jgi:hypothetical protein
VFRSCALHRRQLKPQTKREGDASYCMVCKKVCKFQPRFLNRKFGLENLNKDNTLVINEDKITWDWKALIQTTEDKFQ